MALFKLLTLMRLEWKAAALGFLASLCSTFASVGLMATAAWFLTAMGAAYAFGILLNLFVPSALIRLLAILRTGLRYADRLLSHQATFRIIEKFRLLLFAKALRLEHYAQLNFRTADLERRLQGDIEQLELAYLRQFMPCATAFALALTAGLILVSFSANLLVVFLICYLCCGVLVPALLSYLSAPVSARCADLGIKLQHELSDNLSGLLDLTVLDALSYKLQSLRQLSYYLSRGRFFISLLDGLAQALLLLGAMLCFVCFIALAGSLYLKGQVSAGQTMMLAIGALACFESLQPVAAALLLLPATERSARRVWDLSQGLERKEGKKSLEGKLQSICCVQLGLTLPGHDQPLLEDFSFTFKATENYALTGASGSGKTSLLSALSGLIAPTAGRILYNGIDGRELKAVSLHQRLTLCFQDPGFMSGTVRSMFTALHPQAAEAQIRSALEVVELWSFIESLDGGLDAYLGHHGNALSGGQARRLSLALALFRQCDFLLLDEPGEGLDPVQEERILKRILSYRRGVIMVTHRKSGLYLCDKILRLETES